MMSLGILGLIGLVVFVIAGVIAAEMDSALASVVTFIIGLITLEWGLGIGVWSLIVSNPLWFVAAVILYVAGGALYTAVWRWPEFIRKHRTSIMTQYTQWTLSLKSGEDNSFDAYLDSSAYMFNANDHKERLATWVGMWPFSMGWELARKPAVWVWNTAYRSLGTTFQRIGRATARKIHNSGE